MSKDLYLNCLAHNELSGELGHADIRILQVREWVANRKDMQESWNKAYEMFEVDLSDIFDRALRNAMYFFREHGQCPVEIVDEYGKHYDLTSEPTQCFAVLRVTRDMPMNFGEATVLMPCQRDQADSHTDHILEDTDDSGIKYTTRWRAYKPKDKS